MFHSTSRRVRIQNILAHFTTTDHYMGSIINIIGAVGVPQIFINAQRYIASDSLPYTEIRDPTPKNFMTKMNETQF